MGRQLTIFVILCSLPAGVFLGGCVASTPQNGTLYERLQANDPDVRIKAIIQAGNSKDRKAIPLLVSRLEDNDSEVRMFAGIALQKIVGKETYDKLGWKFYQGPVERQDSVDKWRQWIRNNLAPEKAEGLWPVAEKKIEPTTKPASGTNE